MKKIVSGSIHKNPTELQSGSVIDSIIDRTAFPYSQGAVSWSGTQISFSDYIEIHAENPDGSVAINRIAASASPVSLSNDDMLVVRLSRTAGNTTLAAGTYPGLNAGEYAVVASGSMHAIDLDRKDHVILFWRKDTTGSVAQLIIPLSKQVLSPGTTCYLGSAPIAEVKIQHVDAASTTLPSGASVTIDGVAGANGDLVLFTNLSSGNNEVYLLEGVGTSITWTAQSLFESGSSPSNGDQVHVLDGSVYANMHGEFNGSTWQFNDVVRFINSAGDYWEQTSIRNQTIVDNTTANIFSIPQTSTNNLIIGYSVSRNNTKAQGHLYITHNGFSATVTSTGSGLGSTGVSFFATLGGGNLILTYNASATGFGGTMKYFIQRWSDIAGGPTGIPAYTATQTIPTGYINAAYVQSDGSNIPVNCSAPVVVLGKTQLTLNWNYVVGVNPGSTVGDIDVIADGVVLPRYLAGSTTTAYYREVNSNTIEFWTDLTTTPISLEVRKKYGTIDASSSVSAKVYSIYDLIVGSSAQVTQGVADYSSINTAIAAALAGARIHIMNGTYTENVIVNKQVTLEGKGYSTVINGSLTFDGSCEHALMSAVKIVNDVTFSSGSVGNYLKNSWQGIGSTVYDLGTDNIFEVIGD